MDFGEKALSLHKKLNGKITISLKDTPNTKDKLSTYYTPGVAAVSKYTAKHPKETRDYTWLNNSVAVISDGSAVLGLGDLGPYGALPVMEGKAMLFKHFANIDAVPIILNVHNPEKIIAAVEAIAPSFGGINLEDIAAPKCFEIEEKLIKSLNIPVMHDDQHGTAVVVLAGLINALKIVDKKLSNCRVVVSGAGAAGVAVVKLLHKYGRPQIVLVDSQGVVSRSRDKLSPEKKSLLKFVQPEAKGSLKDALQGADIFIGVSRAGLVTEGMVKTMVKKPIIFAMANPDPEILPSEARKAGAVVVATGRSDFANQVNNALAFPGIFRGALDNKVSYITDGHKIAAAEAIASLVKKPSANKILPSILDKKLVPTVADVIT